MQPKLAEYYRTTNPVPLDFGIGYRHRARESTLMVATRKPLAANEAQAAEAVPAGPTAAEPTPVPEQAAVSPDRPTALP